jgi:hypothetical protein
LSDKAEVMHLSSKCHISEILLTEIINDLCELGEFNKELWGDYKILWNQKFIDSIADAYLKRNNKCITLEGLLTLLGSLGILKQSKSTTKAPDNTQSIVDNTIVKKTKRNKTILSPEVEKLRGNCKQLFLDYYLLTKKETYYWDVIDSTNLPKLLNKIIAKIKEKTGSEVVDLSEVEKGFDLILKNLNDEWVIANLSIANINSKFNTIFTKIKTNAGITKDNNGKPVSKYHN